MPLTTGSGRRHLSVTAVRLCGTMLDALTCLEPGAEAMLRALGDRLGASSMLTVARVMNTPMMEYSMRLPVRALPGRPPLTAGLLSGDPLPVLEGLRLQSGPALPRPLARPALLVRPALPPRPPLLARAMMLRPLVPASGVISAAAPPPFPPCCAAIGVKGDAGPTSAPSPLLPHDASLPMLCRRSIAELRLSARSVPCI